MKFIVLGLGAFSRLRFSQRRSLNAAFFLGPARAIVFTFFPRKLLRICRVASFLESFCAFFTRPFRDRGPDMWKHLPSRGDLRFTRPLNYTYIYI